MAAWLGELDEEAQAQARLIAGVNGILEMRRAHLDKDDARRLLEMA